MAFWLNKKNKQRILIRFNPIIYYFTLDETTGRNKQPITDLNDFIVLRSVIDDILI